MTKQIKPDFCLLNEYQMNDLYYGVPRNHINVHGLSDQRKVENCIYNAQTNVGSKLEKKCNEYQTKGTHTTSI